MKRYTVEEDKLIEELYPVLSAKQIADKMGLRKSQIKNRIHALGFKLPDDIREIRRKSTTFKPGIIPFTKGKKQVEYMSPDSIERTKATRFHKGQKPHNTKYDGAITIRRDVDGRLYNWKRISENNWIHLHRALWEEYYGVIPEDFIVTFVDGNQLNCCIENLEICTRQEALFKNRASYLAALDIIWSKSPSYKGSSERLRKIRQKGRIKELLKKKRKVESERKKIARSEERKRKNRLERLNTQKVKSLIKVPDYSGNIKIKSESPFYNSIQESYSSLFSYSVSLTKDKETAQDLLHEMISRDHEDRAYTFLELKQITYKCYLEEQRVVRKLNHNEYTLSVQTADISEGDIQSDVLSAIKSLSQTDAAIAEGLLLDEIAIDELASQLSISPSEIESRMPNIKKQLQLKLQQWKKN